MRGILWIMLGLAGLTACGSSKGGIASNTRTAATSPARTAIASPGPRATAVSRASSKPYRAFLTGVCRALAARDAGTLSADLANYQYNTGLRYGRLGDGEGTTGDPSLFATWLRHKPVRCVSYTPDVAGHGTLVTRDWPLDGGWAIIDLDTFSGTWKLNDFTFGRRSAILAAMGTSAPVLQFSSKVAL